MIPLPYTQDAWHGGECQSSFFARPRSTPGSGPPPPAAQLPTHYHKSGGIHDGELGDDPDGNTGPIGPANGGDWYAAGRYEAGAPGRVGSFTMVHQGNHGDRDYQCLNHRDNSYAAKDFEDTAHPHEARRLNLMWANLGPSCLTLPRELTFDNELKMLVQSPLPEMALLHEGPALATIVAPTPVPSCKGCAVPLNVMSHTTGVSRGNTSDIQVTFELPSAAGRFGVVFGQSAAASDLSGKFVYVDYVPHAPAVLVGVLDDGVSGARAKDTPYFTPSRMMPGFTFEQLPNLQNFIRMKNCQPQNPDGSPDGNAGACAVPYSTAAGCRADCESTGGCSTWTFTNRLSSTVNATCTMQTDVPVPIPCKPCTGAPASCPCPQQGVVSGINTNHSSAADAIKRRQGVPTQLRLSPRDTNISLRIFVDGSIAEIYWQDGRSAQTISIPDYLAPRASPDSAVAIVSDGLEGVIVSAASVHAMGSAWVSTDEVLRHVRTKRVKQKVQMPMR